MEYTQFEIEILAPLDVAVGELEHAAAEMRHAIGGLKEAMRRITDEALKRGNVEVTSE